MENKIKVIHIIGNLKIGGIQKLVCDLALQQKQNKNLTISIYALNASGGLLESYKKLGIPLFFNSIRSGYDLSLRKYIKAYALFKKFELIHFHSFNPLISLTAKSSKKKIVYTLHSVKGFGRKWKISDSTMKILLGWFLKKGADYVTFNSGYTKDFALGYYGFHGLNSKIVYNGINFNNFIFAKSFKKKDEFVIATHSRFIKLKRIELLITAFKTFCDERNTKLLLIGDGPERSNLELLIKEKQIQSKVILTGFVNNPLDYLSNADVCVYPTTTETFGLAAIEAFYIGKPVLVFKDGGGIAEIVNKISPENVVLNEEGLVARIQYYYDNQDFIKASAERLSSFAQSFSIEKMEKEMFHVYQRVFEN